MIYDQDPASNNSHPYEIDPTRLYEQACGSPSVFDAFPEHHKLAVTKMAWMLYADSDGSDDDDPLHVLRLAWQVTRCRAWVQDRQGELFWSRERRDTFEQLMALSLHWKATSRGTTADGIDTTPPRWLWYPLIPRDALTLIVGQPETGKTALAVRLAAYLTKGEALPNFSRYPQPTVKSAPARVLWYDAESTPGAFRRRLEAAGADLSMVQYVGNDCETTLDAIDTIRADIEAMPTPPAVVVFDTLAGFLPDRCDLERMAPARRLLRPLAALAAEFGIAIVLLHHEGKSQRADLIHVGVGSIGIMGAARSALFCAKHPKHDGVFVMLHAKSSEEEKAQGVAYRLQREELKGASSVRLDFEGIADVSTRDVMDGPQRESDDECGARDEAGEFLLHYLSDGPELKSEVLKAAKSEGITDKMLRRARETLGIESRPQPQDGVPRNRWPYEWVLPRVAHNTQNSEKGNPGQPNDTRINTDPDRVALGCPNGGYVGKGQPKTLVDNTQLAEVVMPENCKEKPGEEWEQLLIELVTLPREEWEYNLWTRMEEAAERAGIEPGSPEFLERIETVKAWLPSVGTFRAKIEPIG